MGHYVSDVLEESHCYPFGLTVSWNPGNLQVAQPYKYQGIELEKHFGLEMYETVNRIHDPQLGIFRQIDPKSELDYSLSPFVAMRNNPAYYTDPFGDVAGDFLDRNGKNLGSDNKPDGKLYVLNTNEKAFGRGTDSEMPGAGSSLSNKDAAKMVASGNINYDEFTEIEGLEGTRQAMFNEVSKDGNNNSSEHGGVITSDNTVIPTKPDSENHIDFNTALNSNQQQALDKATTGLSFFYSHSSLQQDFDRSTSEGAKTETNNKYTQSPSGGDLKNAKGAVRGYVFGMGLSRPTGGGKGGGGQRVYIYDTRGVRATLPLNKFVKADKK